MINNDFDTAIRPLADLLLERAEHDPILRATVTATAETFLRRLGVAQPGSAFSDNQPDTGNPAELSELSLLEQRCRLKAKACDWAAERIRLQNEGADFQVEIAPFDREIIEQGSQLACTLWMSRPTFVVPPDLALLDSVGKCFESLAESLRIANQVQTELNGDGHASVEVLNLVVEAQSALRAAVQRVGGPADVDQTSAFIWAREQATALHVYVERYLVADDLADPDRAEDLLHRLRDLEERVGAQATTQRRRKRLFKKLQFTTSQLKTGDEQERGCVWKTIVATVDELVGTGIPPSDTKFREILRPVLDDMPQLEDLPQSFQLVQREATRFVGASAERPKSVAQALRPEVTKVARLLRGKKAVLIGGDIRPDRKAALERAFGLSELIWLPASLGPSAAAFAPYIGRPEVAVVLLAIRFSPHSFGDVREFCDRYSKPLVWLPGGYGTNQIAQQIMSQCSGRLPENEVR